VARAFDVPTLAEAVVAHAKPTETVAEVRAIIDDHNANPY
jgi:hypothetical protein